MSYDELQKYRDQEPFAPPWSNHLKTFGQMVAECGLETTLTIRIPTSLDAAIKAEAAERGLRKSDVARERLYRPAVRSKARRANG